MAQVVLNQDMLVHLPAAEQRLVRAIFKILETGGPASEKVETFIAHSMREHSSVDWSKLSNDVRMQACADYVVIGLMTGEIKRKDMQKLVF